MESRTLKATLRCGDARQDLEGARMLEHAQHCQRASGMPGVHPATGRGAGQQWNTQRIAKQGWGGHDHWVLWTPGSLQESKWKRITKSSLILAKTKKPKKENSIQCWRAWVRYHCRALLVGMEISEPFVEDYLAERSPLAGSCWESILKPRSYLCKDLHWWVLTVASLGRTKHPLLIYVISNRETA